MKTSKRGFLSADTISSATSSGATDLTPRASTRPAVSSVRTIEGMTTDTSTPEPRSSARTASDSPTTPCFVAQ